MITVILVFPNTLENNIYLKIVPVNTKAIRKLDPFYIGYVWHGLTTIVARNHLHCCEGDRGGRGRRPALHCRRQGRGIHSGTVRFAAQCYFYLRIFNKKLRILWHIPYYLYLEFFSSIYKRNLQWTRRCNITVCPRSSDPFYLVLVLYKWVTSSWTYSSFINQRLNTF